MKKKLFLAPIIAIVVLLLAGCSSSSTSTTPTTTGTTPATGTTGTTPTTASQGSATNSSSAYQVPRGFSYIKGTLPKDVESTLNDGIPIIVAFFKSDDSMSNQLQPMVARVADEYKSNSRYFEYTDDNTDSAIKLNIALGVKRIPFVGVVDDSKTILFEKSGFLDESYLSNAVYQALFNKQKTD